MPLAIPFLLIVILKKIPNKKCIILIKNCNNNYNYNDLYNNNNNIFIIIVQDYYYYYIIRLSCGVYHCAEYTYVTSGQSMEELKKTPSFAQDSIHKIENGEYRRLPLT